MVVQSWRCCSASLAGNSSKETSGRSPASRSWATVGARPGRAGRGRAATTAGPGMTTTIGVRTGADGPYSRPVVRPAGDVQVMGKEPAQSPRGLADVIDPGDPLGSRFRSAVSDRVRTFVERQAPVLEAMGPELGPVHAMAAELLAGGKRLRPAFVVWGFVAAAGLPSEADALPLLDAGASFDLLHASALVHDDVMDSSDLRRGQPAAHRRFEALHGRAGWLGERATFGQAGAILLGDLLIMWSAQLLGEAGLSPD